MSCCFWYRVVPPEELLLSSALRSLLDRTLEMAKVELSLNRPVWLKLFEGPFPFPTDGETFSRENVIAGSCGFQVNEDETAAGFEILVKADLAPGELIRTLLHELRRAWQIENDRAEETEDDAGIWAAEFLQRWSQVLKARPSSAARGIWREELLG